ncbi:hypothetical protein Tco_1177791 [Tanacetum coccineum]
MPGTQDRGCGYFMCKDDLRLRQSSSPGPSTPLSSYPGPSTCPSYYPKPSGSAASHREEECLNSDTMVEENVPAPVPTRSEEQVLPFNSWLLIGKGNLFLDLQKLKKNPIFRISVDILQNTNFFRELTSSANVPNIYIQQLWNALTQEAKTGIYKISAG